MEGILGILIMGGLALISLGYSWVLVLGVFGLVSVLFILGGVGTLMSSLLLSAVGNVKAQKDKRDTADLTMDWR
jgi:hypothetical protein